MDTQRRAVIFDAYEMIANEPELYDAWLAGRLGGWHPKARDLPDWRRELRHAWAPAGMYARVAPEMDRMSGGRQAWLPAWEHDTLLAARLWYVGGQMCDLLEGAARQLPDTPLEREHVPDPDGLVVFERPLAGLDAEGSERSVMVGGIVWGQGFTPKGRPLVGISVYGPLDKPPFLLPLGGLIWPYGRGCEDRLTDWPGADYLTDAANASMAEDRRRLLALWLLASQPGVASNAEHAPDRAARRRAERDGEPPPPNIRVVTLRTRSVGGRPTEPADAGQSSKRQYRHQWAVSGHWRQQAYGPGWSLHRPKYINPHLAGPEDAPLLTSQKVKSWVR